MLPVCGELLWIEILLVLNKFTCLLSIAVSCLATYRAFGGFGTTEEARSDAVDNRARRIVPAAYLVVLGVVYSLDLDDGYLNTTNSTDESNRRMFQGAAYAAVHLRASCVVMPCLVLAAVVVVKAAGKAQGRLATRKLGMLTVSARDGSWMARRRRLR